MGACKSKRKTQATQTPTNRATHETAVASGKKTAPLAEKSTPTKSTNKPTEVFTPLPPDNIRDNFTKTYPAATDIDWSKQMSLVKTKNTQEMDYKAAFKLGTYNNSVIYSDKGELVESKMQIDTEQLPQNIYNAIKKEYPDAHIVSAYSYKSSRINGSYAVVIRSANLDQAKEKEFLLTENGTFVE